MAKTETEKTRRVRETRAKPNTGGFGHEGIESRVIEIPADQPLGPEQSEVDGHTAPHDWTDATPVSVVFPQGGGGFERRA